MSKTIEGKTYWRSLNELSQTKEYQQFLHREFPENASELNDGQSRRHFLKIMGASIALAGFAACRKPVQKILPYTKRPVEVIPGNPIYYASAIPFQGSLTGVLVQSNEGRPTKIEGNPDHPASKGSTSTHHQAAILNLYDPDRSRKITHNGEAKTVSDLAAFIKANATADKKVVFVSEASSSLTLAAVKAKLGKKFKNFTWFTYEPFNSSSVESGNEIAFGTRLRTINYLDKAEVIVSIDDDFLGSAVNSVINTKRFTSGRKLSDSKGSLNRLLAVESALSLTGSNADARFQVKSSDLNAFVFALAAQLGVDSFKGYSNDFSQHEGVAALAKELSSAKGKSVITGGVTLSKEANAAIALINEALGNVNKTVSYVKAESSGESTEAFKMLVDDLKKNAADLLVFVGTNPIYTTNSDVDVEGAIKAAKNTLHLSDYVDETSKLCAWNINKAHFLETWSDGRGFEGEESIIQPLIQPLFSGLSDIEFANLFVDGNFTTGYELVKETWKSALSTKEWEKALHDGISPKASAYKAEKVSVSSKISTVLASALSAAKKSSGDSVELVIKPDAKLFDGRFANNGWLQELPDPISKITWDNVALMNTATAKKLGLPIVDSNANTYESYQNMAPMVTISANGKSIEMPAWILPGVADNSVTVTTGYGRKGVGRVASSYEFSDFEIVGFDVKGIRITGSEFVVNNVSVSATGKEYKIACVQDHHSMEGRAIVRFANLDEYKEQPMFAPDMVKTPGVKSGKMFADPLFTEQSFPEYEPQWGMAIDLTACTGCGVCTIACQAENNIPVIGKREVSRGRELHWIRVDRYFVGDESNPSVVYQPIPCMHCELAPCEQVCPVAATTHSDDGLNQMTYNRCIGTRYCANNCPYKVRRFNFFNYAKEYLTTGDDPEIVQMAMNPDVTIRFRGVMEKCTYCVQRINRAKIETKNATGGSVKPTDGTVVTACQQACPADAIYFGDINDANSKVAKMKANERNYRLLDELNTRPRTSYLAKITNKPADLVTA
ncbi:4Fe-4S dicluster domain-containing protein [bacterium]|nr:MAG: 4Fe-4S dicluster domain-containing protein [bacterium]